MDLGLILQHRKKCIEILYLGVHWNLEKKSRIFETQRNL